MLAQDITTQAQAMMAQTMCCEESLGEGKGAEEELGVMEWATLDIPEGPEAEVGKYASAGTISVQQPRRCPPGILSSSQPYLSGTHSQSAGCRDKEW
ncbi:hypothetical protein MTR67_051937 [Solanum verrucosum]|uniref:Uncharacterized protein n=1 Tax=Solanum verrucosum TaxID=315347 RepID=A0AAF0V5B2_SOLVR|nr:hypothetical protein MTR67_051937 [Solanum verrucosum]